MSHSSARRSVLLTFRFAGVALVGSLTMALVSALAAPEAQLAVLGALVSVLAGLFVSYTEQEEARDRRRNEVLERLAVPLTVAPEHELYEQYLAFCATLTRLVEQTDPVLREAAALKLASINAQLGGLADGTIVFAGTETWRTVYERLLRGPDVREYRSVAWVRSKDYWQDPPGRQSMRENFEAAHRGVLVQRIAILPEHLWPAHAAFPTAAIFPWIEDQHAHGLRVYLVRESDLAEEPDGPADFGIYGDRAVGTQELERSRTVRFTLEFDRRAVRLAADRWERLKIYAISVRDLLDRAGGAL